MHVSTQMWTQQGYKNSLDNVVKCKCILNQTPLCESLIVILSCMIPTIQCIEMSISLSDELGSRATQYLIGLCTNTLGASPIIHSAVTGPRYFTIVLVEELPPI